MGNGHVDGSIGDWVLEDQGHKFLLFPQFEMRHIDARNKMYTGNTPIVNCTKTFSPYIQSSRHFVL